MKKDISAIAEAMAAERKLKLVKIKPGDDPIQTFRKYRSEMRSEIERSDVKQMMGEKLKSAEKSKIETYQANLTEFAKIDAIESAILSDHLDGYDLLPKVEKDGMPVNPTPKEIYAHHQKKAAAMAADPRWKE